MSEPLFPRMQKDTGEIVRDAERRVCAAVWRVLDEMRDEVDDLDRDLYRMIRERMEEEIAYGPEEV